MHDETQQLGEPPDGTAPEPDEPTPEPSSAGPEHLKTRRPHNPKGWYMVLAAYKPMEADPAFCELGWVKANDDDQAKRLAKADAIHGPAIDVAARGSGVILRAVPARSWPKTKPTRYEVTKRLVIG